MSDLIVFSHLRWNSVFQRPHHLISRLATNRRTFFIEDPLWGGEEAGGWEFSRPLPRLTVCQPRLPLPTPDGSKEHLERFGRLLTRLLDEENVWSPIAWFYNPMASPLLDAFSPSAVVYDCMDALDAFLDAPPRLLEREEKLVAQADLLFAGGPSLHRRMESRHGQAYCFPSSVEATHFRQALDRRIESPLQASLAAPRLGYVGVIDERFDLLLLDELARTRPYWQFVMVGPVVKIDPAYLPRHANIHYFGKQPYEDLPRFLAGWDVCLLPFARNEATRFISPTKTLEYMAAERMIVSTPIADVVELYGDIVFLGDTRAKFREACEQALNVSEEDRQQLVKRMRRVLAQTSWDATAAAMEKLVNEVLSGDAGDEAGGQQSYLLDPVRTSDHAKQGVESRRVDEAARTSPVVVVGAGPTGLSAAYHLGDDALLLEANDKVGGWCRSVEVNGFTFDYAGHIMFSKDPYVHELYEKLLGDNVHWQDREAWVYSKQVYTRYPFQGALYGLPPEVIKECLLGAIEARYGIAPVTGDETRAAFEHNGHANGRQRQCDHGALEATYGFRHTNVLARGSAHSGHAGSNGSTGNDNAKGCPSANSLNDCCADGMLESTARLGQARNDGDVNSRSNGNDPGDGKPLGTEPANFEEFIYRVWGRGIAKHFAVPYNRKLWAVPLTEMETSWLGGRVPMPDLGEMIDGALRPSPKPMGPNARFGYPLRGGFQALMNGFLPHVEHRLRLNSRVAALSPSRKTITLATGEELAYQALISTMPLPALIRATGDEAPAEILQAAEGLRSVSVRCVHLGVGRENLTEKHWIYYPEETVFHRIFVQGNASPYCNPPGGFGLTCEITYSSHKPLPCDGDELVQRCIDDCIKVGIINAGDPIWATAQCDMPFAYVVYDHERQQRVAAIREWLERQDIYLAGRYSEWEYYNSDHAFIAGKRAAERVQQSLTLHESQCAVNASRKDLSIVKYNTSSFS